MPYDAVQVNNLNFGYGKERILREISINIPEHSFLVVIGPNGGGKSTFLKLIVGLLKPASGYVEIFNKPVKDNLHLIGYVPQDTEEIKHFPINVLDTAMMGFYRPGVNVSKKQAEKKALEALETFGMKEHKDMRINELSTGMRQKVLLARAIAPSPKIIIMDEPISGIDPAGQRVVLDTLKDFRQSSTIIFVSHDLSVIPGYATAVTCINRTAHYHPVGEVTPSMISHTYGDLASLALVCHECGDNHD